MPDGSTLTALAAAGTFLSDGGSVRGTGYRRCCAASCW